MIRTPTPPVTASVPPTTTTLDAALARDLATLQRAGLHRSAHAVRDRHGATLIAGERAMVDFSSNDYLGLASDPRLARAMAAATSAGAGATAARLISGTHELHQTLERALARFKRTQAALLFTSGYAANVGAIPALASRGDVIYADALNHASLIDGCRLARAEVKVFPHLDLDALDHMLDEDGERYRRRWIVVDSVFSMDGDLFPLDRLVAIARARGAFTYVDDAHATGVLGETGRGSAEHWAVEGEIDVTMGTLGKALGTVGAFVAGSARLCDWLLNRARAFIFTTASPPAIAAATIEALAIVDAEPWRRGALHANARRIRDGLEAIGRRPPGETDGHIIPVIIGDAAETVRMGAALAERGFLVGAVRPPTVPLGSSRLRITASASHTPEQINALLESLAAVLRDRAA